MTRRVLMITRPFYPDNATGSNRPAKLVKYLPRHGWEPLVVCPEWTPENCGSQYDRDLVTHPGVAQAIRVPHSVPHTRPGHLLCRLAESLWPYRAPLRLYRAMLQAATDVAGRERIDAIWSTFTPGLDHTIACRIARQHGLPWVADFRDLPDQTYDTPRSRWCVRSEMRVCRHASALTTVSPDLKARLEARYRQPVLVITNGYDAEDYPPPPAGPTARFTLRYFGRLYAYRDPGPLFSALDELLRRDAVENRDEFRVQFFGTNAEDLAHRLQGHRCQGIVECCARLGRREMVRMQQEASVLLLLKSERAGSTPAKIFEYLGAQRPILNVPGDEGPVDHILRETKAGQSVREAKDIAEAILGHYRTWKACGRTEYEGTAEKLQPYQRAYQAGQLAELLDSLCQP